MNSTQPPASFEAALLELESLVARLEDGHAHLEESLLAYERGKMLLDHCQATLAQAEQKIRMLDAQGSLKTLEPTAREGSPRDER